jgi:ribosomal protein S18 acetylase RimI-like enzyme
MKNINVRPATISDMPAIHALVRELAIYEKAPEAHTATISDYEQDFQNGVFDACVAVENTTSTEGGQVVGMILFYMAYSTWRGKMLYLEDFVVTEAYRQYGVGQLLFDTFIDIARERDCFLVKWQVLDWNMPAIRFYEKNDAIIEQEWYNGKIFLKPI